MRIKRALLTRLKCDVTRNCESTTFPAASCCNRYKYISASAARASCRTIVLVQLFYMRYCEEEDIFKKSYINPYIISKYLSYLFARAELGMEDVAGCARENWAGANWIVAKLDKINATCNLALFGGLRKKNESDLYGRNM